MTQDQPQAQPGALLPCPYVEFGEFEHSLVMTIQPLVGEWFARLTCKCGFSSPEMMDGSEDQAKAKAVKVHNENMSRRPSAVPTEAPVAWTLETAPIGTLAPAIGGGHWCRVENGWKWNGPNGSGSTFPNPGGDWNGRLANPGPPPSPTGPAPIPPEGNVEATHGLLAIEGMPDNCDEWTMPNGEMANLKALARDYRILQNLSAATTVMGLTPAEKEALARVDEFLKEYGSILEIVDTASRDRIELAGAVRRLSASTAGAVTESEARRIQEARDEIVKYPEGRADSDLHMVQNLLRIIDRLSPPPTKDQA